MFNPTTPHIITTKVGDELLEHDVLNEIRERLVRVETLLTTQIDLRDKVNVTENRIIEVDACVRSNTYRLKALEANSTWLWRTIVGAIIATTVSVIGLLISRGG